MSSQSQPADPPAKPEPSIAVMVLSTQLAASTHIAERIQSADFAARSRVYSKASLNEIQTDPPDVVVLHNWRPDRAGCTFVRLVRQQHHVAYLIMLALLPDDDPALYQQALRCDIDDIASTSSDAAALQRHIRVTLHARDTIYRIVQDRERFRFLTRMNRRLQQFTSLRDVLKCIVSMTTQMLKAEHGNLIMLHPDANASITQFNVLHADASVEVNRDDIRLVLERGAAGYVIKTKQSLRIADIATSPHWLHLPGSMVTRGAALIVPLIDRDETLGTLSVYHTQTGYFCPHDQALLELVARQAAVSIRQAYLREAQQELTTQLTEQARQLRLINTLAQTVAANLDFEVLYKVIDKQMINLMGDVVTGWYRLQSSPAMLVYSSLGNPAVAPTEPPSQPDQATQHAIRALSNLKQAQRFELIQAQHLSVVATLLEHGYVGGMVLPLRHQGYTLGVLIVAAKHRSFSQHEESLLEMARPHIALALANAQDVADRAARQAERIELTHLRNMAELSGQMAHHFNNLFAAILGNAQLAELDAVSAEQREVLEAIVHQIRDGAAMISRLQLLKLSDHSPPSYPLDLSEALPPMIEYLLSRPLKGITVNLSLDPAAYVDIHERELQTICTELITNANESGTPPGTIDVQVWTTEHDVLLSVRDQGRGIPPEHQQSIWRPFWTTQGPHRMGLGLAICSALMWRVKGEIKVLSNTPEPGTTVLVQFPRADTPLDMLLAEQSEEHV